MKMKRRRFYLRCLWVLALLAVVGVWAYMFILPWYVHQKILSTLHDAGITDAGFDVRRVSPWRLELIDVRAGDVLSGPGRSIVVTYSPSTLWDTRIQMARLSGLDLTVTAKDGRIEAGELSRAFFAGPSAGPKAIKLPLDRVEVLTSFLTIKLPTRSIRLPVEGTFVRREDGRFTVDATLTPEDRPLHLAGTIGPMSDEFDLEVKGEAVDVVAAAEIASEFTSGTRVQAGGNLGIEASARRIGGRTQIRGTVKAEAFSLIVAMPGKDRPAANFDSISGVYKIGARLAPDAPSRGSLVIGDAGFRGKSWGIDVEGMNGEIVFEDLIKFKTRGPQTVTVGKAVIGKMTFVGGAIVARMDSSESMLVYNTKWGWCDGTISAEAIKIDLSNPAWDFACKLENADVNQVLGLMASDRVAGQGRVSGQVSAHVNWPVIRIASGDLRAVPGGAIQVKDFATMAASLPGVTTDEKVKRKIFEALGDFKYDVLKVELRRNAKGLSAYVDLVGRGRVGDRQALHVEPTINGLDPVMDLVLGVQQRLSEFGQDK